MPPISRGHGAQQERRDAVQQRLFYSKRLGAIMGRRAARAANPAVKVAPRRLARKRS